MSNMVFHILCVIHWYWVFFFLVSNIYYNRFSISLLCYNFPEYIKYNVLNTVKFNILHIILYYSNIASSKIGYQKNLIIQTCLIFNFLSAHIRILTFLLPFDSQLFFRVHSIVVNNSVNLLCNLPHKHCMSKSPGIAFQVIQIWKYWFY